MANTHFHFQLREKVSPKNFISAEIHILFNWDTPAEDALILMKNVDRNYIFGPRIMIEANFTRKKISFGFSDYIKNW